MRKVVRARDVPRFSPEFLAEERRELGNEVYSREYDCEFGDVGSGIFQRAVVQKALSDDVTPLFRKKG